MKEISVNQKNKVELFLFQSEFTVEHLRSLGPSPISPAVYWCVVVLARLCVGCTWFAPALCTRWASGFALPREGRMLTGVTAILLLGMRHIYLITIYVVKTITKYSRWWWLLAWDLHVHLWEPGGEHVYHIPTAGSLLGKRSRFKLLCWPLDSELDVHLGRFSGVNLVQKSTNTTYQDFEGT